MAAATQMFLPLICVVLVKSHALNPSKLHLGHKLLELPRLPLDLPIGYHDEATTSGESRPANGDVYSYNTHAYNNFYHDGDFSPPLGMEGMGYYGYSGPFGMGNFNQIPGMPFGIPTINNGFNLPSQGLSNGNVNGGNKNPSRQPDNNQENRGGVSNEQSGNKPANEKKHDSQKDNSTPAVAGQKIEELPPKTNEVKRENDKTENKDKVALNAKKDYLLVGGNGNGLYLLHENTPNINTVPQNTVVVPNTYQQPQGNVVYVPYNSQPSGNQVYQVVNGQPVVSSNVPLTANRQVTNGYNIVSNPVQGNSQSNGNNPSYVLIYANGQLIQVPGIVISSPQNTPVQNTNQATNVVSQNTVPVYTNPQNQGGQIVVQVPNNLPNTGVVIQNPQSAVNPNNNNIVNYGTVTQPNTNAIPQQTVIMPNSNTVNGYIQTNPVPSNQGVVNGMVYVNPNIAQPSNNQGINNQQVQPAVSFPINSNGVVYSQPTQEKEANINAPPITNVVASNSQPLNNGGINSGTLGVQPAVMVSGFKDNEGVEKSEQIADKKDKNGKSKKKDTE